MTRFILLAAAVLGWLCPMCFAANNPEPPKPDCANTCTGDYFFRTNDTADCAVNDQVCICKDPVFPHILSCCLADKCNASDAKKSSNWIQWVCGIYKADIPAVSICLPPPDPATSTTSSSSSSSSSISVITTALTPTTSTWTSKPVIRTTMAAGPAATAPAPRTTSPSKTIQTPSKTTPSTSTTTTTSSTDPPLESKSTNNNNNQPNTLAIGLGVGLGVGIPLTLSALGLVLFLVWRIRHHRNNNTRTPSPLPARPFDPDGEMPALYRGAGGLGGSVGLSDFDKRWHPAWAADMVPAHRRQPVGGQMSELAS